MFRIVRNLGVSAPLGTLFSDKCIIGIFPIDRKALPFNFSLVEILVVLKATSMGTTEQFTEAVARFCTLQ